MKEQPTLETQRLVLRPLQLSDASSVQLYAGDSRIAEMTDNIPHPYEDGMAEEWIESVHTGWSDQNQAGFAICRKENLQLTGCCGLMVTPRHKRASLGYWMGVDHWGKGFCTEAAGAVLAFGFSQLNLRRIEALHLSKNPASGAVMKKIGMKHECTLADYVFKDNCHHDMEAYFILG